MNNNLQKRIKKIRKEFTEQRIRELFAGRKNESFFADLGEIDEHSRAAHLGGHFVVWHGYHLMLNSPYLEK